MKITTEQGSGGEWRPTFWVVERFENDKSIGYWDGGHSRAFVTDIDKAVQFCRQQDAMWTIVGWHWKDVQITEHTRLVSPSPSGDAAQVDIRWAVNVILEKIAEKFDGWETLDIWKSDAAMVVRGFKHSSPSPSVTEEQIAKTIAWALCEHVDGGGPGKCDDTCICFSEGEAAANAVMALIRGEQK